MTNRTTLNEQPYQSRFHHAFLEAWQDKRMDVDALLAQQKGPGGN
jgi:hypothetical protein